MVLKRYQRALAIVAASCFTFGALAACGNKANNQTHEPEQEVAFGFAKSDVYTEKYKIEYLELVGAYDLDLEFSSSDTSIVTVSNNGAVTGCGEGTAVVTATYGDSVATVSVRVSKNKSKPELFVAESATVARNEKFLLTPQVTYKNSPVNAAYSYSVDGSGISVSPSGEVTGNTAGEYTVTVRASYVDVTLERDVAVRVVNSEYFHLDARAADLYLSDAFGDGLATSYTARVYTDKTGDIAWQSSNTAVASVSGGVITPVGAGICTVTASTGGSSASMTVTVKKPTAYVSDVKDITKTNSTFVLDLNDYSAFLNGKTVNDFSVTQESGESVRIIRFDGRYLTLDSGIDLGEQTLKVETDSIIIDCPVITASMIVSSKDDFKLIKSRYFGGGANSPTNVKPYKYRDGYFILGDDIDFGGETFAIDPRGTNSSIIVASSEASHRAQVGWYGVLDGRGHVVKNIASGKRGLFGNVEKDSEIKNIAFIGTFGHTDGTSDSNSGFVAEVIVGKLDNVFVAVDKIPVKETANANADIYGKAGICTLLYGEINNTVCAITSVQNSTATGFNPSVLACRVEGNPIDVQPFGSMTNTFGLARGNLTAVSSSPNHSISAYRVLSGFGVLKNTVDARGFRSFWSFSDDSLSFGDYVLNF